jgi:hypothetical protein
MHCVSLLEFVRLIAFGIMYACMYVDHERIEHKEDDPPRNFAQSSGMSPHNEMLRNKSRGSIADRFRDYDVAGTSSKVAVEELVANRSRPRSGGIVAESNSLAALQANSSRTGSAASSKRWDVSAESRNETLKQLSQQTHLDPPTPIRGNRLEESYEKESFDST